jgi:hypothetical protein
VKRGVGEERPGEPRLLTKLLRYVRTLPCSVPLPCDRRSELVIVTGADNAYRRSLQQLLTSLFEHEPDVRAIVFDLGLAESERARLEKRFPTAEWRRFDFDRYPAHLDIKVEAGQYAWKPVILRDVMHELRCCVCWMDSANVVTGRLSRIRAVTRWVGMYSACSKGSLSDWTHPGTLERLDVSEDLLGEHNLDASCVAVYYRNARARAVVDRWARCALRRECIAPEGSSRQNHRQDQAVLSVLAHQSGIALRLPTRRYGFTVHQGVD